MRLGILASHPIQYQAPWFRALAKEVDLEVFFAHRQTAAEQGRAGFGVAFEWDVDLLSGYQHRFLSNVSRNPGVNHFAGCDTPEIADIISGKLKAESRKQKAEMQNAEKLKTENLKSENGVSISASQNVSVSPFDAFIVTGWYLKSYLQAVRACRRVGVPVLVRGDSQLGTPRPLLKRVAMEVRQRWLLRQFDGFLSVGQRHREYLEHFGVPPKKIFFAPHFVDNEWFKGKAEIARKLKAEIRKQWGAGIGDFVALFVGKLQAIKRPADLLKAMVKLREASASGIAGSAGIPAGGLPAENQAGKDAGAPSLAAVAVFVGSGELENELRELVAREKLRVHFAGFKNQTELPALYAAADVLVLPSESETWGLVVNEAMACGLPAVVSDAVGCAPDLIDEGRTGFTFPVGDVQAFSEKLQQIAAMRNRGEDFRPALAEKMRAYSVEAAVRGTMQAVEKLAQTNSETLKS